MDSTTLPTQILLPPTWTNHRIAGKPSQPLPGQPRCFQRALGTPDSARETAISSEPEEPRTRRCSGTVSAWSPALRSRIVLPHLRVLFYERSRPVRNEIVSERCSRVTPSWRIVTNGTCWRACSPAGCAKMTVVKGFTNLELRMSHPLLYVGKNPPDGSRSHRDGPNRLCRLLGRAPRSLQE